MLRDFPTRETEFMHKNDPVWEYGFYEPPLDTIPKGKIMLREAMEVRIKNIIYDFYTIL